MKCKLYYAFPESTVTFIYVLVDSNHIEEVFCAASFRSFLLDHPYPIIP